MKLRAIAVFAVFAVVVSMGSVAHAQNHAQHYVLDAFGGVHASGGAPVITPASPYFGFDVAANIEYVAVGTNVSVGDGYIVLDKWGGVHLGGALIAHPPGGAPIPYFGFDAARSVVRRDAPSRIAHAPAANVVDISVASSTFTVLATANIVAPIDGWLFVTGKSYMGCSVGGADNDLSAWLSINVDATTDGAPSGQGLAVWNDCSQTTAALYFPTNNQTVTAVYPVTAGPHTVNLLGRKDNGTGTVRYVGRLVTAQFIAADSLGGLSLPATAAAMPPVDPSVFRQSR